MVLDADAALTPPNAHNSRTKNSKLNQSSNTLRNERDKNLNPDMGTVALGEGGGLAGWQQFWC
jgi:hypothetical protein